MHDFDLDYDNTLQYNKMKDKLMAELLKLDF